MNKSFITKLPTAIDNADLPIFKGLTYTLQKGAVKNAFYSTSPISISCAEGDQYLKIVTDARESPITQDTVGKLWGQAYAGYYGVEFTTTDDAPDTIKVTAKSKYDIVGFFTYSATLQTLEDVKYISNMLWLVLNDTSVSGDISNLKDMTAMTRLLLNDTSVSGDISNLKDMTAMTQLLLNKTSVSGDISTLSNMPELTVLNLNKTSVSGDISNLINGSPKLNNLYIPSTITITEEQIATIKAKSDTATVYVDGVRQ